jgi:galactonate dehydratase
LAGGERAGGLRDLWPLITDRLLDILIPDIKYCGGVQEFLSIVAAANVSDLGISPHNPSGPISTAFSAHLASIIPNLVSLEFPFREIEWRDNLLTHPEPIVRGTYKLSGKESIGVELCDSESEVLPA